MNLIKDDKKRCWRVCLRKGDFIRHIRIPGTTPETTREQALLLACGIVWSDWKPLYEETVE